MAFVPRTFPQIVDDMLAYISANSEISDNAVGSVVRTLVEAAALEDDEQYFQMVQLLDMFSLTSAQGPDLDRRLADFGIARRGAQSATVRIRVSDTTRIRSTLDGDVAAGATIIPVLNSTSFPTTGYPYVVRLGEGTANVEDVSVTNNNTATNELTISAPSTKDHEAADLAVVTTGTVARAINTGTQIQVPPTVGSPAVVFNTVEPGQISVGNLRSNDILARAVNPGAGGNVSAGRITRFVGSGPFTGAIVTNVSGASGGSNRESDSAFRLRALDALQGLSRGTPLAIESGAVGIQDPETGQRVVSSALIEDFSRDEVVLYIDDGSGFVPDFVALPVDSLAGLTAIGATSLTLNDASNFPTSGYVLIDNDGVNNPELLQYSDKVGNSLTLVGATTITHNANAIVRRVRVISDAAESGQRRFRIKDFPIVRSSERIYINDGVNPWEILARDTDYVINYGTSEFQIVDTAGLSAGTVVVAQYNYYTNLVQEVQKVMEGDPDDYTNYPGIKAAGVFLFVEAPVLRRVTVRVSISAIEGFTEESLAPEVQRNIEDYINSLRLGQDVFRSKIIDVAHNVQGVESVSIIVPSGNITILENELAVPVDSSGNSLVTVF